MDIQRPDLKVARRRRQTVVILLISLACISVFAGLRMLRPAAPVVDASSVWPGTVKRGSLLRKVRGNGTLVPEDIQWIAAQTDGLVANIVVLPGELVQPNTVIMELSNPQVEQETIDAEWQLRAAEAEYESLKVRVENDLMNQQASAATVAADYGAAKRQADTDGALASLGVISGLTLKTSQGKEEETRIRNEVQEKLVAAFTRSKSSQLAVQEAKVEQFRALLQLKRKNRESLKVRAGIAGVLQNAEAPVHVGQRLTAGTILAKVAQPGHLKAELKIAETQAKDIQIGQPATVDTHNGVVNGTVFRVDPAVLNGTVNVDIRLAEMPPGARPDLSVDGTINLENLTNVLYVDLPALATEKSMLKMFRYDPDGRSATRTIVKFGRSSVDAIEILDGLKEGDRVILSDMSRWDNVDRIRIE